MSDDPHPDPPETSDATVNDETGDAVVNDSATRDRVGPDDAPPPPGATAPDASASGVTIVNPDVALDDPPLHVVLYQPEIPPNTGNVGRTCVAAGATLWLVEPLGFSLDQRMIRRSGLDYWRDLDVRRVADWDTLVRAFPDPNRFWFFTRHAERNAYSARFRHGDVLVFGRESSGLPREICSPNHPTAVRIPTSDKVRSLNLATAVGIAVFEHRRMTAGTLQ